MYYRGAQAAIVVYDITNQVPKQITIANKFVDCCLLTSGCVIPIAWRATWLLVFAVYARTLLLWYRCSWCAWCNFFFPSTKQHYKRWSLELYVLYIPYLLDCKPRLIKFFHHVCGLNSRAAYIQGRLTFFFFTFFSFFQLRLVFVIS